MYINDFMDYVNLCKAIKIIPTWKGLNEYKEGLKRNVIVIS